jgi:hypothetical protein
MRRHRFARVAAIAVLITLTRPVDNSAQQPSAAALVRNLSNQALNDPGFDPGAASDSLIGAGLTGDALSDAINQINRAYENGQKLQKKDGGDQNGSGTGDWNLRCIIRGTSYHVTFPVTNACRVGATVTITYPAHIAITGPQTVQIPPKSTIDVDMTLLIPPDVNPPPDAAVPIGTPAPGISYTDQITLEHPSQPGGKKSTPAGTYTYVCNKMHRDYSIYAHVHWPTPEDKNQGGGGKPAPQNKKMSATCERLWNYGEFAPADSSHPSLDSCRSEIFDQMQQAFTDQIPALRAQNPAAWTWLPAPSALNGMSVPDLLTLKTRADSAALSLHK